MTQPCLKSLLTSRTAALLLAMLFCAREAACQDALVTFYAPAMTLKAVLPDGRKPFYGNVFDGDQRLFLFFSHEHWQPDRFVTLRMPAGTHAFSASNKDHAPGKDRTEVTLEPGKRYFIRATVETRGVGDHLLGGSRPYLTPVDCEDALKEAKTYHPLKPQDPPPVLLLRRVDETAFPSSCDYVPASSSSPQPAPSAPSTLYVVPNILLK